MKKMIKALKLTMGASIAWNLYLQVVFTEISMSVRIAVMASAVSVWLLGALVIWAEKKDILA